MRPLQDSAASISRIKVFLVDDHPLVREGLQKVIAQEPDLEVCGEAEESNQAYAEIERRHPQVVVLDLSLRRESGLDLIKRLQDLPSPPRILVLSMHDELHYAERALRAGAQGYVMKRESSGKVLSGIRQIVDGKVFVSEAIAELMTRRFVGAGRKPASSTTDSLSDRELEIFRRMGLGQETRRIADELCLSLKTVQTHCAHIKEKLGLENATALMRAAVQWVESERRG